LPHRISLEIRGQIERLWQSEWTSLMPTKTFILTVIVMLSVASVPALASHAQNGKHHVATTQSTTHQAPHLVGVLASEEGQPIVAPLPPAVLTGSAMFGGAMLMKFFRKLRKLS
jgi:hypothetical protein